MFMKIYIKKRAPIGGTGWYRSVYDSRLPRYTAAARAVYYGRRHLDTRFDTLVLCFIHYTITIV